LKSFFWRAFKQRKGQAWRRRTKELAFANTPAQLPSHALKSFSLPGRNPGSNYSAWMTDGHHAKIEDNRKAILKLKSRSCPLNTLNNAKSERDFG
jgi:hypothetical protein